MDELDVLREEMRRRNLLRRAGTAEDTPPGRQVRAAPESAFSTASMQQEPKTDKKGQLTLGEFEYVAKAQPAASPQRYAGAQPQAGGQKISPLPPRCAQPPQIRIVADNREFNSGVARNLLRAGAFVEPRQLAVGDYILSDRCCAERKESGDFVQSLIDGRLFEQMIALRGAYLRPILIIEGPDITSVRNMNPLSIYSAIASISVDFGIPILQTRDAKETANLLYAIARREQTDSKREIAIRGEKPQMSTAERQQFIIESLPGISSVLAKRLLCKFGTVKRIVGAEPDALEKVEGIGPVTAEEISRIASEIYPGCKDGRLRKGASTVKMAEGSGSGCAEGACDAAESTEKGGEKAEGA